jgi:thiaminase
LLLTPSLACTAYSRYILDVGQSEDWLALQMALAPCLIGYGAIAKRLYTEKETLREGNRYWRWIENYVAEDYTEAVRLGSGKNTFFFLLNVLKCMWLTEVF